MKKLLLLLAAVAWTSTSCEKDDICDQNTATTPRLIIHFYDVNNPTLDKTVTNLAIVGEGLTEAILFNGVSVIQVPLKTTFDVTKYKFILNYGNTQNPEIVNEDDLEFHYSRNNFFISRACGYKTLFTLYATNPYILTDGPNADDFWIKTVDVSQPNISNENEIHIKMSIL